MTREQARESAKKDRHMAEIKEAFANGEAVQNKHTSLQAAGWTDCGEHPSFHRDFLWRIKPKPTIRYWSKPEDVPVGRAVMRREGSCVILAITESGVNWIGCGLETQVFYNSLAAYEHALIQPDGTLGPWLPCGKEVV